MYILWCFHMQYSNGFYFLSSLTSFGKKNRQSKKPIFDINLFLLSIKSYDNITKRSLSLFYISFFFKAKNSPFFLFFLSFLFSSHDGIGLFLASSSSTFLLPVETNMFAHCQKNSNRARRGGKGGLFHFCTRNFTMSLRYGKKMFKY